MSLKHKLAAHDPSVTTIKQYAEIGILPPYLGVNELGAMGCIK